MYWVKSRASLVLEVGVWMGTWWGTSQPHQLEGHGGGRRNTVGVEKYTTDNTLHIQDVSHFSKFCVCVCVWCQFVNSAPFMFIFKKNHLWMNVTNPCNTANHSVCVCISAPLGLSLFLSGLWNCEQHPAGEWVSGVCGLWELSHCRFPWPHDHSCPERHL